MSTVLVTDRVTDRVDLIRYSIIAHQSAIDIDIRLKTGLSILIFVSRTDKLYILATPVVLQSCTIALEPNVGAGINIRHVSSKRSDKSPSTDVGVSSLL